MLLAELSQAHDRVDLALQDASIDGQTVSQAHFLNKQHHHITHNVGRFGVEGTCFGLSMAVAKLLSSELRCCNMCRTTVAAAAYIVLCFIDKRGSKG